MSFDSLFYPRGVAVVGSVSEGKLGYQLIRQVLAGGYEQVFAVNPKARGLGSASGYDAIAKIEQPVDLAIIASPAPTVAEVLEDCGRAGVGAAVVITSGFSEAGNAAGEKEIRRIADRHGIRIVGPNCAGIGNTGHRLFPTLEVIPECGQTALVSQSGALMGAVLAWAEEQALGFSKFVSFGNRADLGEADFLRYLAGDPETRVVALYVESVADGRAFMEALEACTRRKPVVVIKSGRSQTGQRATLSHTGSMAGADTVYDAAIRECGAIRVKSIEEMFDLCKGFVHLPAVRGKRIAIVTNSGGPGVLAADHAEEMGLSLPEPSQELRGKLSAFLPGHCALRNPIDLTVEGTESGYRETLVTVLTDCGDGAEFDAALALNVDPPYLDSVPLARGVHDAIRLTGKPIAVNFMAGRTVADGVAYMQEHGIPNFPTGERGVAVLARMADYYAWIEGRSTRATAGADAPAISPQALPGAGQMLEPEAMAWLAENGIPVPAYRMAAGREEAVHGAREIGYPVVMKVVSPDILHKSDYGGVIVGVDGDDAVRTAFDALREAAAGKDFRGAIIYPQIRGAQEVLLGLSHDRQFGPVVVFGLGGIYTEILHDVSLRVAPVDYAGASAMIREIKSIGLLTGARGRKPCDLDALAHTLVRLSQLPFRYPEVREVDLNPVFLLPEGLLVGDVRVIAEKTPAANGKRGE